MRLFSELQSAIAHATLAMQMVEEHLNLVREA